MFSGGVVQITGKDFADALTRQNYIQKIHDSLTTEELEKLSQMTTPKGKETLKSKWGFIKKYI